MTKVPSPRSSSSGSVEKRADIDAFLNKVRETPRSDGSQAGLIFALDATMSQANDVLLLVVLPVLARTADEARLRASPFSLLLLVLPTAAAAPAALEGIMIVF